MAAKRKLLDEHIMWAIYRPERKPGDRIIAWMRRESARKYSSALGGTVKHVRIKVYEE